MALRKMPDGSMLDTETGVLSGFDVQRESAARDIAIRSGMIQPGRASIQPAPTAQSALPNRGQQITPVQVVQGPNGRLQTVIRPDSQLAVNPFELGLGAMSDTTKKMMLTALVVGGAFGAVWLNNKLKGKKKPAKHHHRDDDESDD